MGSSLTNGSLDSFSGPHGVCGLGQSGWSVPVSGGGLTRWMVRVDSTVTGLPGPLGEVEGKNLKGLGADDSAAVFCFVRWKNRSIWV